MWINCHIYSIRVCIFSWFFFSADYFFVLRMIRNNKIKKIGKYHPNYHIDFMMWKIANILCTSSKTIRNKCDDMLTTPVTIHPVWGLWSINLPFSSQILHYLHYNFKQITFINKIRQSSNAVKMYFIFF